MLKCLFQPMCEFKTVINVYHVRGGYPVSNAGVPHLNVTREDDVLDHMTISC